MLPVDLHSEVGRRQENIHSTFKDDEHIDVAITIGVERFVCSKRLFMTVGLEPLN